MNWISRQETHLAKPQAARAFTIIELLVVVGIIIVLLGLVVVGMNAGTRTAQKTNTAALMNSISKGLVRFKEDVGYYPPVLGVGYTPANPNVNPTSAELRRLFPNSVPNPTATYGGGGSFDNHLQQYFSTCTLADYLVGYGSHQEDGYGRVPGVAGPAGWEIETPPLGIRNPGADGVWGALILGGGYDQRMKWHNSGLPTAPGGYVRGTTTNPYPIDQGKILGPYLELQDERLLAGINYGASGLETYFPGDALPAGLTWDTIPKAIVDYWGMPIRYYRRPYPPGALNQSYRAVGNQRVPTLGDVFVLRPWELPPRGDVTGIPDAVGDTATTQRLMSAEFGLVSSGPDKAWEPQVRRDDQGAFTQEHNKDNIIEVGP